MFIGSTGSCDGYDYGHDYGHGYGNSYTFKDPALVRFSNQRMTKSIKAKLK